MERQSLDNIVEELGKASGNPVEISYLGGMAEVPIREKFTQEAAGLNLRLMPYSAHGLIFYEWADTSFCSVFADGKTRLERKRTRWQKPGFSIVAG